ncbi:hypothetical protein JCM31598_11480 [Desulfonatronum parangueonense]
MPQTKTDSGVDRVICFKRLGAWMKPVKSLSEKENKTISSREEKRLCDTVLNYHAQP